MTKDRKAKDAAHAYAAEHGIAYVAARRILQLPEAERLAWEAKRKTSA